MHKGFAAASALLLAIASGAACTVHNTQAPSVSGVSEFGLSLAVTAIPDSLSQDGASQSSIAVTVRDANSKVIQGEVLRVDMSVGGVVQDFGTLSARTIVTGSDGIGRTVYTAPPPPPPSAGGSGTRVAIVVTPIGNNAQASSPESGPASIPTTVDIRLVPPGVILPPASTPTPAFTITPTPVNIGVAATFDASRSCGGAIVSGTCDNSSPIASFAWTFGDGGSATGMTVNHTFTSASTFSVTLTVTNSRGLSASTTQQVSVTISAAPSGDWVFSPTSPVVGDTIVFNADGVRAAAGRTLVQYSWIWGDNTAGGSGFSTTHVFNLAGTFNVTLTVLDDAGQKATFTHAVTVGTGNPIASLLLNKTGGNSISADGGASTAAGSSTITTYTFVWGDNTANTTGGNPVVPHTFAGPGTFTVRLVVTDNLGRTGSTSQTVTVP